MNLDLFEILKEKNIEFKKNEPMFKHTTFKVGGNADLVFYPKKADDLIYLIKFLKENKIKYVVIGRGSNVVFEDSGYKGVVIFTEKLKTVKVKNNEIFAEAGVCLSKLSLTALDNELAGLEFAHGIPGSLGGAVYMNAGAYDGEMKNVISSVKYFDGENIIEASADKLDFSYRHSIFTDNENLIILSSVLKLCKGNKKEISDKITDFTKRRKDKQPLEYPSAGSTFKRPCGYYASKIIEDAGLKGYTVGGMQVSLKHAGFIINTSNGTTDDLKKIIGDVQKKVFEKFSVVIETEVKFIV